MRVRLLKSFTNQIKTFPIGQVLNVQDAFGNRLIKEGTAIKYSGKMPPDKMKTNLFKPK